MPGSRLLSDTWDDIVLYKADRKHRPFPSASEAEMVDSVSHIHGSHKILPEALL